MRGGVINTASSSYEITDPLLLILPGAHMGFAEILRGNPLPLPSFKLLINWKMSTRSPKYWYNYWLVPLDLFICFWHNHPGQDSKAASGTHSHQYFHLLIYISMHHIPHKRDLWEISKLPCYRAISGLVPPWHIYICTHFMEIAHLGPHWWYNI